MPLRFIIVQFDRVSYKQICRGIEIAENRVRGMVVKNGTEWGRKLPNLRITPFLLHIIINIIPH